MSGVKNKIVVMLEDCIALEDNDILDDLNPDKTIYDLKTKSIKKGEHAILIEQKEKDGRGISKELKEVMNLQKELNDYQP